MDETTLRTVRSALICAWTSNDRTDDAEKIVKNAIEKLDAMIAEDKRARQVNAGMYEALVRLVNMAAILPPDMDAPGSALAQARAAIAKAENWS